MGRGNHYIQLVKILYCKLPTNIEQLQYYQLGGQAGIQTLISEVGGECATTEPPWLSFHVAEGEGYFNRIYRNPLGILQQNQLSSFTYLMTLYNGKFTKILLSSKSVTSLVDLTLAHE